MSFNGVKTTIKTGSVGVAPGTAINGNYEVLDGAVEDNSSKAIQCAADLKTAYNAASGAVCPPSNVLQSDDLSGNDELN